MLLDAGFGDLNYLECERSYAERLTAAI